MCRRHSWDLPDIAEVVQNPNQTRSSFILATQIWLERMPPLSNSALLAIPSLLLATNLQTIKAGNMAKAETLLGNYSGVVDIAYQVVLSTARLCISGTSLFLEMTWDKLCRSSGMQTRKSRKSSLQLLYIPSNEASSFSNIPSSRYLVAR